MSSVFRHNILIVSKKTNEVWNNVKWSVSKLILDLVTFCIPCLSEWPPQKIFLVDPNLKSLLDQKPKDQQLLPSKKNLLHPKEEKKFEFCECRSFSLFFSFLKTQSDTFRGGRETHGISSWTDGRVCKALGRENSFLVLPFTFLKRKYLFWSLCWGRKLHCTKISFNVHCAS